LPSSPYLLHPNRSNFQDRTVGAGQRSPDFSELSVLCFFKGNGILAENLLTKILFQTLPIIPQISGLFQEL
jgi:hypothetical protein